MQLLAVPEDAERVRPEAVADRLDEVVKPWRLSGAVRPYRPVGCIDCRMLAYGQNPQAACDAPRWRYNAGLEINVEAAMDPATVAGLQALGHRVEVINDSYQDFGAGQFIWRLGEPGIEGYVAASDPRRDGQAVAY